MLRDKRTKSRRGLLVGLLTLTALFGISSSALAGPDDLKGGSVAMQLQGSRGLKLKPSSITLPITGGAVDPVDGSGLAQVSGAFKAKRGKGKTKVKIVSLTLGANGGPGSIAARVNKDYVATFATLRGGTVSRAGYGANIQNVSATIAGKGAQALNRAFSPRKKGKGAKKSARGGVKAGQPLGKIVSMTTIPLAVQIVPGTGTMSLHTDAMGPFVSKLPNHCIDPLPTASPPGVAPIAPATTSGLLGTDYTFPVTTGAVAPDFSAGEVFTAGGQTITKNSTLPGIVTPSACTSSSPPTGTQLGSTDLSVAFTQNFLRSIANLPGTGAAPRAPLATIDFSTGTRSVNPNTNVVTVTGATVRLADLAAGILNQVFPNESSDASQGFATGDGIGTIDITGVKLR